MVPANVSDILLCRFIKNSTYSVKQNSPYLFMGVTNENYYK